MIWENIKIACKALFSNKLRALLTMLGIIIGIGSVIAIMTVSESLTTSISESFQEMGANNVTVGLSAKSDEEEVRADGMRFGASGRNVSVTEEDRITDRMISKLKKTFKTRLRQWLSVKVPERHPYPGMATPSISMSAVSIRIILRVIR